MYYEEHWGLTAPPFDNVPDPQYYFPSAKHETARQRLLYGIQARKGAVMLTGEIGCGKTLLSRALILNLPRATYDVALVANPALSGTEFLAEILYQFGLDGQGSKAELLHRLNDHLLANQRAGLDSVLVVDKAQAIEDDKTFEDLRLLCNFQLNHRFLLTLVLMGQPELKSRVAGIAQLSQRIAIRYHLEPFTCEETGAYISARMKAAGCQREVFTKDACFHVFKKSRGVSRLINTLCDLSLLLAYDEKVSRIDEQIVKRASLTM